MVASQKIVLAADTAVQLPPYADNIIFESGTSDLQTCHTEGGTYRAVATEDITASALFMVKFGMDKDNYEKTYTSELLVSSTIGAVTKTTTDLDDGCRHVGFCLLLLNLPSRLVHGDVH